MSISYILFARTLESQDRVIIRMMYKKNKRKWLIQRYFGAL